MCTGCRDAFWNLRVTVSTRRKDRRREGELISGWQAEKLTVADIADDDGCESIEGEDRMPLLRVSIAGSEASIEMGECRAQVGSGQILCADGLHNLILLCVSMRIYAYLCVCCIVGVNECAKSTVHHISTRKFL